MRNNTGMTLVELCVTMCIIAITLMYVVPGVKQLLAAMHSYAITHRLVSTLNRARILALQHHAAVIVCPSKDLKQCGRDWHQGLIAYIQNKQNPKSKRVLISVNVAIPAQDKFYFRGFNSRYRIVFSALGLSSQNGSFYYCPYSHSHFAKKILLNRLGRVRVQRTQC